MVVGHGTWVVFEDNVRPILLWVQMVWSIENASVPVINQAVKLMFFLSMEKKSEKPLVK